MNLFISTEHVTAFLYYYSFTPVVACYYLKTCDESVMKKIFSDHESGIFPFKSRTSLGCRGVTYFDVEVIPSDMTFKYRVEAKPEG